MKCVKTQDAVGHVLCHDITQIIKDVKKGTAFRKGHIVTEEDIPVLLSLGKDNLYIWEKTEGILHENEAAEYLRDICMNENMIQSEVKEGKIELIAEIDGLLKIDVDKLRAVNSLGEMMIATRHTNTTVKKGDKLVGTRIIPLLIEQEKMEKAKEVAGDRPILSLIPFKKKKVGIVTTGNEVFYGRIKDTFGPVVAEKVKEFGADVIGQTIVNDDMEKITKAVEEFIEQGADMVLCTGGMSVDPDDKTPGAIKNTGARIVSYGAPVLPGAMFLLSYKGDVPIVGLPGCVMYSKRTVFDLILPRIMADDKVSAEDKSAIESALENLKSVKDKESSTAEELKTAMDEVMNKFHKISEQMYQQAQAAQGAEGAQDAGYDQGANAGNGDDNVVDADFTEVDDK